MGRSVRNMLAVEPWRNCALNLTSAGDENARPSAPLTAPPSRLKRSLTGNSRMLNPRSEK